MATDITVDNVEEFAKMVDKQDFRLSKAIVDQILNNLTTSKKHIHVLSITCISEDSIYDITVDRKHFAETLEEHLPVYIREEYYEDCRKIADAIQQLKKKTISEIITKVSKSKSDDK
jgi:hypothetical protein